MVANDRPAILIVDDNADKQVALESILVGLNVTVVKAASGEEALRRLLVQDFAVVLLDVRMPVMDGFETAALIRQRPRTARTPIIFITAFGDETHVARGYSLRAVDYLLAPIVPDVLRTKVAVLTDLYRASVETRRQAERLRHRALQLRQLSTAALQLNSASSVAATLTLAADNARHILATEWAIAQADTERHPSLQTRSAADDARDASDAELGLLAAACGANRPQQLAGDDGAECMAAPFTGRDGRGFGGLLVRCRDGEPLGQEDEDLLVQLAHMTAVAIENTLYREAHEADRMKDEFLATVSHELRTPLSAMLSWTWMLRRGKLDAAGSTRAIEAIERNAQAQARLVDDLLDVSRIMTGKVQLTRKPVDLGAVVLAAIEAVDAEAQAKGVTLARLVVPGDSVVVGDADRLQQVVCNLLSNAIKFTPRGGVVDVKLDRVGEEVVVRVSDTGAGIAAEFLPHVFERFRQADSSSTRKAGGLGLGLAIVRHLVEMHGGRVEAHSDGVDRGSTFVVALPGPHARVTREPVATAPAAEPAEVPGTLSDLRILIVEDEPDARDVLAMLVGEAGAEVTAVGTAPDALEAVVRWHPDLVVCDIGLPGEDGYSLIGKVRALTSEEAAVPAIALTAYARSADRARALAAGFQAHLAKPFEPRRLLDVLARLGRARRNQLAAVRSSGAIVQPA